MARIRSFISPPSTAGRPPGRCWPGRLPRLPGGRSKVEPVPCSRTPALRLWLSPGRNSIPRSVWQSSTGSPCSSPTPPLPGEAAVDPLQLLKGAESDLQFPLLVSIVDLDRRPKPIAETLLQLDDLHRAKCPHLGRGAGLDRLACPHRIFHLPDTPTLGDGTFGEMVGEGSVLHPDQRAGMTGRELAVVYQDLNLQRQLQKTQRVGDGGSGLPHPVGHSFLS